MSLSTRIRQCLLDHPWQKAKDVAGQLDSPRKAINSTLYANPEIFSKNEHHQWTVIDANPPVIENELENDSLSQYASDSSIYIENIDLVERLEEQLKDQPYQKASELAEKLIARCQLVTKTLFSFQDIFAKNNKHEWYIQPECVDRITGKDAEAALSVPVYVESHKQLQQAIIEARLDKSFLVLAPPGTGKTHTLVERLVHTLSKSNTDVDPGELLVLSFTRAAVGEIRKRIELAMNEGAPGRLRYVKVRTFDSYATWILNDGGYDIAGKDYDARIENLTVELKKFTLRQETDRIGHTRYLFIDEIQDLVGIRADMVFELVKRVLSAKGSVTLLGDPHQSLNDYQISDGQTDSAEFLLQIKELLSGKLEEFELEESHRYETNEMRQLAKDAKNILDSNVLTLQQKHERLFQLIPDVSKDDLLEMFEIREVDALLCRSNGEVFHWDKWLDNHDMQHMVNAGAMSQPWPAWIGAVVMKYKQKVMSIEYMMKQLNRTDVPGFTCGKSEVINFLDRENLLRGGIVDLKELAARLYYLSPAESPSYDNTELMLSTVHKAKGLEYKNVVIVEPRSINITDEEVRVLYVALTRAKRNVYFLRRNNVPFSNWTKRGQFGHLRYSEKGVKYFQVLGLDDFDLDTLFMQRDDTIDVLHLQIFLSYYQRAGQFVIQPEEFIDQNDHGYALYMTCESDLVRICSVNWKLKKDLDAMSWGNRYGSEGCRLVLGEECKFQTITHPMESPVLARHIGAAGIMVFPSIQGFYPIEKATGE